MAPASQWLAANPGPVALELSSATRSARVTPATSDPQLFSGIEEVRQLFAAAAAAGRKLWAADAAEQQRSHHDFLTELGWPRIYCARTIDRTLVSAKQKAELPTGQALAKILVAHGQAPVAHRKIALEIEDEDRMWRLRSRRGLRVNATEVRTLDTSFWRVINRFEKAHGFDVRGQARWKDGAAEENRRRDDLKAAWLTARSIQFNRDTDEKWAEPSRCDTAGMPARFASDWDEYELAYQSIHRLTPLKSTAREIQTDGRIRPAIKVNQAVTGRMSITSPAVQSFPHKRASIRHIISAERGNNILSVDHSNAELKVAARLMAKYMGETSFIDRVMNGDVYAEVAEFTGQSRHSEKWRVIASMYGLKQQTLAKEVGELQAAATFEALHELVPEIPALYAELTERARRGECFETLLGRPLPQLDGKTYETRFELQTNLLVQGSARDFFSLGVRRTAKALGEECLFIPLHDELFIEVPAAETDVALAKLQQAMTIDIGAGVILTGTSKVSRGRWGS